MRACRYVLLGLGALLLSAPGWAQTQDDLQAWQQTIRDTSPAEPGCFTASYPATQWQEVACPAPEDTAQPVPAPSAQTQTEQQEIQQVGGSAGDYAVMALGSPITSAEGSFPSVTGVTSITDTSYGSNNYTLQLNSNRFPLSGSSNANLCGGQTCRGWVQFIYSNTYYGSALGSGSLFIEYWLLGIAPSSCPKGTKWNSDPSGKNGCFYQDAQVSIPAQAITNLGNLKLGGKTANGMDTVTMTVGGQAYSRAVASPFPEFSQLWQSAEFNIFGYANYSSVNLNTGAKLTGKINISTAANLAACLQNGGTTAESSNLNLNSPCCPVNGATPSVTWAESTTAGTTVSACTSLTGTAASKVTPQAAIMGAGGGEVSPGVPFWVVSGTTVPLTAIPSADSRIFSASGTCGGALSGNVLRTNPVNADCTATVAFTLTSNYTVTLSAGANGTISPQGALPVPSGTTRSITITPNSGYTTVTPVGGTCGGRLNGTLYVTNAITKDCTVAATFTPTTPIYTVTASAGTGGTISPSGSVLVTSGKTQAFTLTPNANYKVSSVGGTCGGTLSGNTYTTRAITGSCTVTAVFAQASAYNITLTKITPSGSSSPAVGAPVSVSASNGSATFNITPPAGATYVSWLGDIGCSAIGPASTWYLGSNLALKVGPVTGNCTFSVVFTVPTATYTVTASAGAGGTISPAGATTASSGAVKTYTVTPNAGYGIASVGGTCGGTLRGNTYTTNAIIDSCTVMAAFAQTPPTYNVKLTKITPSSSSNPAAGVPMPVSPNGTGIFGITPPTGATYVSWTGDSACSAIGLASTWYLGSSLSLKVGPITGNCNFSIVFTP